ncbi:MAG: cupin domain-containing protein [Rubrobacteraceae bacterium]|uniref:cupin domain-containing protein n=1 Tax=Rubrobacter calidifluminis TaxID=1392640 RepID=UPI002360B5D9|nr:cupin domain-containing protein [Rubrobacter calidifluminis]MBX6764966.1 cupin domain-containing protein [Rubrobacteraceae bacterium]MCL6439470.1 cupin domain-containing protein [Rubrobacteraceae bacterium]
MSANVKYLPANGGRAFAHLGTSLVFKDEPEENGDALLLFECRMPATNGVPPHTERNNEAFYVLEGTLEIEADGERYRLGPGDFLSIRPGVLHALHNPGPGWLRALMLTSPGSQHVRFFTTLGEPIDDPLNPPQPSGPPDFEELAAVARECGMEFVRP